MLMWLKATCHLFSLERVQAPCFHITPSSSSSSLLPQGPREQRWARSRGQHPCLVEAWPSSLREQVSPTVKAGHAYAGTHRQRTWGVTVMCKSVSVIQSNRSKSERASVRTGLWGPRARWVNSTSPIKIFRLGIEMVLLAK